MFRYRKNPFLPDEAKAGDIIGFSGDSWISTLVNIATYGIPFWSLSHVGILGHADDGRLLLFESTQLDDLPCEITGEVFLGTQAHQLEHVVHAYKGKVWHYPAFRAAVCERGRAIDRLPDGDPPCALRQARGVSFGGRRFVLGRILAAP